MVVGMISDDITITLDCQRYLCEAAAVVLQLVKVDLPKTQRPADGEKSADFVQQSIWLHNWPKLLDCKFYGEVNVKWYRILLMEEIGSTSWYVVNMPSDLLQDLFHQQRCKHNYYPTILTVFVFVPQFFPWTTTFLQARIDVDPDNQRVTISGKEDCLAAVSWQIPRFHVPKWVYLNVTNHQDVLEWVDFPPALRWFLYSSCVFCSTVSG